jgi:hypothetical protein
MARPSRPALIDELRIDRDWALMVRGNGQFDAADFDISACYSERGHALPSSRL